MKRKEGIWTIPGFFMLFGLMLVLAQSASAQTPDSTRGHGRWFMDRNGDGVNDLRDADGDGIPNWKDPDFVRSAGGKGPLHRLYLDANGDGINDLRQDFDQDGAANGRDPDYLKNHPRLRNLRMGLMDSDGDGIRNWKDPDWTRPDGWGRRPHGPGPKK